MVSFFSPSRYMGEAFVAAISESVLSLAAVLSSLLLNAGALLYIPSWNLASLSEDVLWAIIPQEVSDKIAPKISM